MRGELPRPIGQSLGPNVAPPRKAHLNVKLRTEDGARHQIDGEFSPADAFAIWMVITIPRERAAAVEYDPVYAEFLAALDAYRAAADRYRATFDQGGPF